MCKILLRFAEHYESPKFRNKIFTLKEFKAWYRTTIKGNKFTYYNDWAGFNIPSYAFKAFREQKFNPLSAKEKLFMNIINNLKEPFYIIAARKGHKNAIKHETAHALFYLDAEYRKKVLKILPKIDLKDFKKRLLNHGYCKDVLSDEFNAYIVDGAQDIPEDKYTRLLCSLFDKYIRRNK